MITCYIALGSNLDDPESQLQRAVDALREHPALRLATVSSVYRSAPVGPGEQPDYLNAVLAAITDLAPLELLDALQAVENAQGREREERWAPRTIDLDILLYGDEVIDDPRLQVPHPAMAERNFVLVPLTDICSPEMKMPAGKTLGELVEQCPPAPMERTRIRLETC